MTYGAIDLHSMQSQVRIVTETGEIVDRRIPTTRDQLTRFFPPERPMRILLEASTDSEWVAQCLEAGGHEVVVADPNYAPMYGHRTRRIKTDRRDGAALAEACRQEIYRPAHRTSATQRAVRRHLQVRRQLVRSRSRAISLLRTMLRGEGLRLPSGVAETVPARLATLVLPSTRADAVGPLVELLHHLNAAIATADRHPADLGRLPVTGTRHGGSDRHPPHDGARHWAGDGHGMSRALLKLSGSLVHDYATISDDSPSPNRASRARRAATSAGIS